MNNRIITISREYAAYGRTIAAALSKELGVEYYDKDFVKKTAEESGYDAELVEEEGESLSHAGKLIDRIMSNVHSGYSSTHDDIFRAQCRAILELSKEPCIIVGRCANHVLREAGIPSFDIFLYASPEDRLARASEIAPEGTADLKKYIRKQDDMRRTFYRTYTGKEMGDASNYNICLDVGTLGVEQSTQILLGILR